MLKFILKRKVMIALMTIMIVLLGGYAFLKMDKELNPAVGLDGAIVQLFAGDTNVADVERDITTPMEQEIEGIEGVERIDSTTTAGMSSIQVTFERNLGDELIGELETAVHSFAGNHTYVEDVFVGQFGADTGYDFFLDISGGELKEMSAFAKDVLKPRLEELEEVGEVLLSGALEPSVNIAFNRDEMEKQGLTITQVTELIQQANSEAAIGKLESENGSPSLRWNSRVTNIEDLKQMEIPAESEEITLESIADITMAETQDNSYVWKNGEKDFVFVQIGRGANVTQIDMAEAVRSELADIRDEGFVTAFSMNEIIALGDFVEHSMDDVSINILIGGLIAIAVLLLFLRNFRATFIIGLSIPISILLTILSIWLLDYSLNLLTLIALGLGIGMMVDASIVILESIYRKKKEGMNGLEAVLIGTKEVATAIIASMLTTIVVFVPIGLVGGDIGKFVIILSVTVAITLISSVIVAFTLIPSLAEKFMKVRKRNKKKDIGNWILAVYEGMVGWIIEKKRRSFGIIMVFAALFVLSLALIPKIPMNTMPEMFQRYTEILVEVDNGIASDKKEELAIMIDQELGSVEDIASNYVLDQGDYLIAIINMTKGDEIQREQKEVTEESMNKLRGLQDSEPIRSVQSAMAGAAGYPVQLQISGSDFEELEKTSENVAEKLKTIDGIVAVTTDMDHTSEVENISLKTDAIDDAGLSPMEIRSWLEQAMLKMPLGELSTADEQKIPINAMWNDKIDTKQAVLDLEIPTLDGEKKLSAFMEFEMEKVPGEISHKDGERYVSVFADIEGKDLGAINREVQDIVKEVDTPAGYNVGFGGDLEVQQELLTDLAFVFIISLFLVYFVMAVQFNHFGQPLIVMAIIPVTLIGVVLGLFVTQMELNIMSGMGIIMLIGIVLNNAILLLDRTNQLLRAGKPVKQALIESGADRIRPIFMTTFTTAGGMLPLALASGQSANYQAPLSTVIISGLLFSTLITLVLIPAVFRLFSRKSKKDKRYERVEETA